MTQGLMASSGDEVVFGLGATGLSCARFLHRNGRRFVVIDTRDNPPELAVLQREMPEVPVFAGAIPDAVVEQGGAWVVSPGIALDHPVVMRALAAGAQVSGDIDLFMRAASAPVVGITGSNAKSTNKSKEKEDMPVVYNRGTQSGKEVQHTDRDQGFLPSQLVGR